MRLAAYFLAMAEMTEESSPPLSRTPVGDVGHQLALYGGFKCVVHSRDLCAVGCPAYRSRRGITFGGRSVVVLHSGIVHPVAGVPAVHLALAPTVVVAGKERLVLVAETLKGFQLTAEVDVSILVASYIRGITPMGSRAMR